MKTKKHDQIILLVVFFAGCSALQLRDVFEHSLVPDANQTCSAAITRPVSVDDLSRDVAWYVGQTINAYFTRHDHQSINQSNHYNVSGALSTARDQKFRNIEKVTKQKTVEHSFPCRYV